MREPAEILSNACEAILEKRHDDAAAMLAAEYPFISLGRVERRYSALESMRLFVRDGFIDRYSGKRLIFPGTLRLLSQILPRQFPFQNNWKTDACHFGYYELFPTVDHLIPVSRGGSDDEDNWVSTSMLKNTAKANFTIEELGWRLHPSGELSQWDGLTGWFMRQVPQISEDAMSPYLRRWAAAATRVMGK